MPEQRMAILMLGASDTGRTKISLTYTDDTFEKNISIDGKTVVCEIIDTSGQDELKELRKRYIQESDGFVIVYSVDDKYSYDLINDFYEEIINERKTQNVPIIIFANNCELQHSVPLEEARAKSSSSWNNTEIFEISNYQIESITRGFEKICRMIMNQGASDAKKGNNKQESSKNCCEIQ